MRDVSGMRRVYDYTSRVDNDVTKDIDATNVGDARESKKCSRDTYIRSTLSYERRTIPPTVNFIVIVCRHRSVRLVKLRLEEWRERF